MGKRNLLVREVEGAWQVAAVLDWEFAVSGSPLIDAGHFLRHIEPVPPAADRHFLEGFVEGGGKLPYDWSTLSHLLDAAALCESLTHEQLPHDVTQELLLLLRNAISC